MAPLGIHFIKGDVMTKLIYSQISFPKMSPITTAKVGNPFEAPVECRDMFPLWKVTIQGALKLYTAATTYCCKWIPRYSTHSAPHSTIFLSLEV